MIARREPVVECTHRSVEQCHYTYTTQVSQVEVEVGVGVEVEVEVEVASVCVNYTTHVLGCLLSQPLSSAIGRNLLWVPFAL